MEEMNRRESVVGEEEGRNIDEYKRDKVFTTCGKGNLEKPLMLSSDSLSLE